VISYSLRKSAQSGEPGALVSLSVTSGALRAGGGDVLIQTSYRRVERLEPGGGETTTSEGRHTR
jgi:eukaryotic-like serine/threonine-protein kinase